MNWREFRVEHARGTAHVRAVSCADAVWRAGKLLGIPASTIQYVTDGKHTLRSGDKVANGSVPIPHQLAGLSLIAGAYCAGREIEALNAQARIEGRRA